jgi:hypothetical protein
MAGHIHHGDPAPIAELERSEAELDRDATRLLFGQAIEVLARQGANQRCLAVIDVPGRAEYQAL